LTTAVSVGTHLAMPRWCPAPLLAMALASVGCHQVLGIEGYLVVPQLDSLQVSTGEIQPGFDPAVHDYWLPLGLGVATLQVTPGALDGGATIRVGEEAVASGASSQAVPLRPGENRVEIVVAIEDEDRIYTVTAVRGGLLNEAQVKPEGLDALDRLGTAVALSGEQLVIGAVGDDSAASGVDGDRANAPAGQESGAVYAFGASAAMRGKEAFLKASNTGKGDGVWARGGHRWRSPRHRRAGRRL